MSQSWDGRQSVSRSTANGSPGPGAQTPSPVSERGTPDRRGWSASDERAFEHQQLAKRLEASDVLRSTREAAEAGSTEDADFLFALSLAQADEGVLPSSPATSVQGNGSMRPTPAATPEGTPPLGTSPRQGHPMVGGRAGAARPPLTPPRGQLQIEGPPGQQHPGRVDHEMPELFTPKTKKKGMFRGLKKSLGLGKSSKANGATGDGGSAGGSAPGSPGRLGRPSSSEVQTVSASPLGSPFGLRGPQSWPPGPQSSPSYNAAGAGPTSQASPGSYQGGPGSNGELVPALRSSGAYGAATPPDLVEAGPQGPEPEVRPDQGGSPPPTTPAQRIGPGTPETRAEPPPSPLPAPMNFVASEEAARQARLDGDAVPLDDGGVGAAGYRELLLNAQALHSDLQKTLADKEHTLVRLEVRGDELQEDMRSVRHHIDTPEGWEAFSLYSQQQADLEGRLRRGKQQSELLRSCMGQLQDMQAFVMMRRPHPQDVEALQDATFKELLRRLQNLEVDPTLGHMFGTTPEFGSSADLAAAAAAGDQGGFEDGPAGEVRAICQARAHIDFDSVLQLLRHIRLAKEQAMEEDEANAAAEQLTRALSSGDPPGTIPLGGATPLGSAARVALPLPVSADVAVRRASTEDEEAAALEAEERLLAAQQAQLDAEAAEEASFQDASATAFQVSADHGLDPELVGDSSRSSSAAIPARLPPLSAPLSAVQVAHRTSSGSLASWRDAREDLASSASGSPAGALARHSSSGSFEDPPPSLPSSTSQPQLQTAFVSSSSPAAPQQKPVASASSPAAPQQLQTMFASSSSPAAPQQPPVSQPPATPESSIDSPASLRQVRNSPGGFSGDASPLPTPQAREARPGDCSDAGTSHDTSGGLAAQQPHGTEALCMSPDADTAAVTVPEAGGSAQKLCSSSADDVSTPTVSISPSGLSAVPTPAAADESEGARAVSDTSPNLHPAASETASTAREPMARESSAWQPLSKTTPSDEDASVVKVPPVTDGAACQLGSTVKQPATDPTSGAATEGLDETLNAAERALKGIQSFREDQAQAAAEAPSPAASQAAAVLPAASQPDTGKASLVGSSAPAADRATEATSRSVDASSAAENAISASQLSAVPQAKFPAFPAFPSFPPKGQPLGAQPLTAQPNSAADQPASSAGEMPSPMAAQRAVPALHWPLLGRSSPRATVGRSSLSPRTSSPSSQPHSPVPWPPPPGSPAVLQDAASPHDAASPRDTVNPQDVPDRELTASPVSEREYPVSPAATLRVPGSADSPPPRRSGYGGFSAASPFGFSGSSGDPSSPPPAELRQLVAEEMARQASFGRESDADTPTFSDHPRLPAGSSVPVPWATANAAEVAAIDAAFGGAPQKEASDEFADYYTAQGSPRRASGGGGGSQYSAAPPMAPRFEMPAEDEGDGTPYGSPLNDQQPQLSDEDSDHHDQWDHDSGSDEDGAYESNFEVQQRLRPLDSIAEETSSAGPDTPSSARAAAFGPFGRDVTAAALQLQRQLSPLARTLSAEAAAQVHADARAETGADAVATISSIGNGSTDPAASAEVGTGDARKMNTDPVAVNPDLGGEDSDADGEIADDASDAGSEGSSVASQRRMPLVKPSQLQPQSPAGEGHRPWPPLCSPIVMPDQQRDAVSPAPVEAALPAPLSVLEDQVPDQQHAAVAPSPTRQSLIAGVGVFEASEGVSPATLAVEASAALPASQPSDTEDEQHDSQPILQQQQSLERQQPQQVRSEPSDSAADLANADVHPQSPAHDDVNAQDSPASDREASPISDQQTSPVSARQTSPVSDGQTSPAPALSSPEGTVALAIPTADRTDSPTAASKGTMHEPRAGVVAPAPAAVMAGPTAERVLSPSPPDVEPASAPLPSTPALTEALHRPHSGTSPTHSPATSALSQQLKQPWQLPASAVPPPITGTAVEEGAHSTALAALAPAEPSVIAHVADESAVKPDLAPAVAPVSVPAIAGVQDESPGASVALEAAAASVSAASPSTQAEVAANTDVQIQPSAATLSTVSQSSAQQPPSQDSPLAALGSPVEVAAGALPPTTAATPAAAQSSATAGITSPSARFGLPAASTAAVAVPGAAAVSLQEVTSDAQADQRAVERQKRAERQAALDRQRAELAERRRLRKESQEAGPRVRFAVEEGSAPGDGLPRSYAPAAAQRLSPSRLSPVDPQPQGRQRRSSSMESLEALAAGLPPGHLRTGSGGGGMRRGGSQERLHRRSLEQRAQRRDPGAQRMSSLEKQMELLEIQMLLGRHRDKDRSAAAALDQDEDHTAGRLSDAERMRIREQRRRERGSSRQRASSASLDSTSWESSSDASSLASSKSPLDLAVRGRPPGAASKRPGGMPVMTGSAGLPTIGAVGVGNGEAGGRHRIRAGSSAGSVDMGSHEWRSSSAAALSGTQPMGEVELAMHFRALATDIRNFEGASLAEGAAFLLEIRAATKKRPPPADLGIRNWPGKKVAALVECIDGWQEVQRMTSSLQRWHNLRDFSCIDECTRMETYLRIVKQNWATTGGSEAFIARCGTAGVRWTSEPHTVLRRASLQLPKVYLERVVTEVGASSGVMPKAERLELLRGAARLTAQVQQFAGGLDRDCSIWLKRAQNLQAQLESGRR